MSISLRNRKHLLALPGAVTGLLLIPLGAGLPAAGAAETGDLPTWTVVGCGTVVEGERCTITATLDQSPAGPVGVAYETADGTAVAGEDYEAKQGGLRARPGTTQARATIATNTDLDCFERTETFDVHFTNTTPEGANLATERVRVTIKNGAPDETAVLNGMAPIAQYFAGHEQTLAKLMPALVRGACLLPVAIPILERAMPAFEPYLPRFLPIFDRVVDTVIPLLAPFMDSPLAPALAPVLARLLPPDLRWVVPYLLGIK